jgi:hypothetical protein
VGHSRIFYDIVGYRRISWDIVGYRRIQNTVVEYRVGVVSKCVNDYRYAATMSKEDAFDPFGLLEILNEGDEAALKLASFDSVDVDAIEHVDDDVESPPSPPPVSRVSRSSSKGIALPPKINVKLTIAEEVSSTSNSTSEGASNVAVEGSIQAQVQCSDAMKNAPFCLERRIKRSRAASVWRSTHSSQSHRPSGTVRSAGRKQLIWYSPSHPSQIMRLPPSPQIAHTSKSCHATAALLPRSSIQTAFNR